MFKAILKIAAVLAALFAALAGYEYWKKQTESDYIEIYSDDEDDTF
ncbi:MAG: hypothetical protein RSC96_07085 [Oscillospiraceae bacterium]